MKNRLLVLLGFVVSFATVCCDGDELAAKHVQDSGMDAGSPQRPPLPADYAGKLCEQPSDCEEPETGCGLAGQCTTSCSESSVEDFCGASAACVTVYPSTSYGTCQRLCDSESDCTEGLECRPGAELRDVGLLNTLGTTLVNAAIDALLGKKQKTVRAATADAVAIDPSQLPKTCRRPVRVVQLEDGLVGSHCKVGGSCGSGQCLAAINALEHTPAGYCSGICTQDDQCGQGGVCYRNAIETYYKMEGTCVLKCNGDDAQCHEGDVCRASRILGGDTTYCLPRAAVDADADAGS